MYIRLCGSVEVVALRGSDATVTHPVTKRDVTILEVVTVTLNSHVPETV